MGNMSYCRFRNTVNDLEDCQEHLFDAITDRDEQEARNRLIEICQQIASETDN